jgi:hypothetical protein
VNPTDFPNTVAPGGTVAGYFGVHQNREALSQANSPAIFIRSANWSGLASPYLGLFSGTPNQYGLGTLFHELLHKQSVGGGFSHGELQRALRTVGRNPVDFSGNGISRELGKICF